MEVPKDLSGLSLEALGKLRGDLEKFRTTERRRLDEAINVKRAQARAAKAVAKMSPAEAAVFAKAATEKAEG